MLSNADQQLFVDAMHDLNNAGIINILSEGHNKLLNRIQAHFTSAFFPWHRYFLFKVEEYIRNMDDKYACFALPWWDFNHESGNELNPYILNSLIGGNGNNNDYNCVYQNSFNQTEWHTRHICYGINDIKYQNCCLKRCATFQNIMSAAELMQKYIDYPNYGSNKGFRSFVFLKIHTVMHSFFGGDCSQQFGSSSHLVSFYSPDDPILYLIHGYIDYLWWLFNICNGYVSIDSNDLDNYPNVYEPYPISAFYPKSGLDDPLLYDFIDKESWWISDTIPTPRNQFNLSYYGVTYDHGTLWYHMNVERYCINMPESYKTNMENPYQYERTPIELYTEQLRNELYTEKYTNAFTEYEILQTIAAKTCQYNRLIKGKQICNIPNYTDGSIELCDNSLKDTDISLEYLLNRKGISSNNCLKMIRINLYQWAKEYNKLHELCNGKLDHNICEIPVINIKTPLITSSDITSNKSINKGSTNVISYTILSIIILSLLFISLYITHNHQLTSKLSSLNDGNNEYTPLLSHH